MFFSSHKRSNTCTCWVVSRVEKAALRVWDETQIRFSLLGVPELGKRLCEKPEESQALHYSLQHIWDNIILSLAPEKMFNAYHDTASATGKI